METKKEGETACKEGEPYSAGDRSLAASTSRQMDYLEVPQVFGSQRLPYRYERRYDLRKAADNKKLVI